MQTGVGVNMNTSFKITLSLGLSFGLSMSACSPVSSNISKNSLRNRNAFSMDSAQGNERVNTPDVRRLFDVPYTVQAVSTHTNVGTPSNLWSTLTQEQIEQLIEGQTVTLPTQVEPVRRLRIQLGFDIDHHQRGRHFFLALDQRRLRQWVLIQTSRQDGLELKFNFEASPDSQIETSEDHPANFERLVRQHLTQVSIHFVTQESNSSSDCQNQTEENLCDER